MPEAYIYDHVRTPRGRGKKDGALHEVPAVRLAASTLEAIEERNGLDTGLVDDVILGCVDPIGEAGGDIARAAVFTAGYRNSVPGMQINRFCASGLDAVNMGRDAGHVRQPRSGHFRRRREHEPHRAGRLGRGLGGGPAGRPALLLHAAGRLRRPHRLQVRLFAR